MVKRSTSCFFVFLICCCFLLVIPPQSLAVTVSLQWDPNTETDLAGYRIYYAADSSTPPFSGTGAVEGASPLDVQNRTSATISGLDPTRNYSFAVTAYNSAGVESSYSNIVSINESLPPLVSLITPSNGSVESGAVTVSVTASDNVGVARVEFYVNGLLQAASSAAPYQFTWDTSLVSPGQYSLYAKAYDAAGNVGQSGTTAVTVVRDVTAPTVSLVSPGNNASVKGNVTVSAVASDDVRVSRVEFSENGTLSAVVNTEPYSYIWSTALVADGIYTLTATAYDTTGNRSSSSITVRVSNGTASSSTIVYGDINGDGVVDIVDAQLALMIAVGKIQPTVDQVARGDVAPLINGVSAPNGKVDTGDVIVILSAIVNSQKIQR